MTWKRVVSKREWWTLAVAHGITAEVYENGGQWRYRIDADDSEDDSVLCGYNTCRASGVGETREQAKMLAEVAALDVAAYLENLITTLTARVSEIRATCTPSSSTSRPVPPATCGTRAGTTTPLTPPHGC